MSRINSNFNLQGAIDSLKAERTRDLGRIEGLFENFGVTAKQDLADTLVQTQARNTQSAISRGLSQTTRRQSQQTGLDIQGARGRARIDEQVAGQKAGFLERQLIDPSLITNLVSQAAAVNTTPVRAQLGATAGQAAINAGTGPGSSGLIRPGGGGGGGGASPGGSSGLIRAAGGGGSAGAVQGARVIPSPNAAPQTGTTPGSTPSAGTSGARVVTNTPTNTPPSGTTGQASLRSGQASGTGSIRSTATGQGFETQTGQAQPSALGAGATDVTAAAGTGGGGRSVVIEAGVNANAPGGIGSRRTVSIPPGVSNIQAFGSLIPFGWRVVSG